MTRARARARGRTRGAFAAMPAGRARASLLVFAALLACAACERRASVDDDGPGALASLGEAPAGPADSAMDMPPPPAFDARAAFAHVARQVGFGPRAPGSAGHGAQLAWMREWLGARADTLLAQPFEHRAKGGRTVPMTNLLARFRPDAPDRLLLVAHWDTRPTADADPDAAARGRPIPGANDGASGTAVLLELADVLSRHSPPIGVDLLFVDGEDFGPGEMYLGATHFAANLPPGPRPFYGVVVDMVGDADPRFPVEENSWRYAPEVVDRVWRVAERLGHGARFPRETGSSIQDDHIPLNRAGLPTVLIIDFEYGPGNRYWHTHRDGLENVSPVGLGAVGEVLTALVFQGG